MIDDTDPAATTSLIAGWEREWRRSRRDRATPDRLASWGHEEPHLLPYRDLDTLFDATFRGLPQEDADQVLAAVVRRAASDDLAALVALRRVLPGLLRIAARRAASGRWSTRPLFDDLATTAWLVIRTYPMARRPAKIAVNILRDAEYLVCVRPFRLRASRELALGDDAMAHRHADLQGEPEGRAPHAGPELAEVLAEAGRAGVPADDVQLLRSLYLEAEPVQSVARRLGVTPRTVLTRRLAATARVRAVAA